MIKIVGSSAVGQNVLDGLTTYRPVWNFLQCTFAKTYYSLVGSRQSYGNSKQTYFFGPSCIFWVQLQKWELSYVYSSTTRRLWWIIIQKLLARITTCVIDFTLKNYLLRLVTHLTLYYYYCWLGHVKMLLIILSDVWYGGCLCYFRLQLSLKN